MYLPKYSPISGTPEFCCWCWEFFDHSLKPDNFFKLCCLSLRSFDLNLSLAEFVFEDVPVLVLVVELEAVEEAREDKEGFSRASYCWICSHLASTDSSLVAFGASIIYKKKRDQNNYFGALVLYFWGILFKYTYETMWM